MENASKDQADQHHHRPAAESDHTFKTSRTAHFSDNRSEAIAQRRLADAINASPSMIAQRKAAEAIHTSPFTVAQRMQLRSMYGEAAQLKDGPEKEELLQGKFATAQQTQGRVQPTMQMKDGIPVNDDAGLEHEADVMGAKALAEAGESMNAGITQCIGNDAPQDHTPVNFPASIQAKQSGAAVAQLILGRLGGYTVNDATYANGNWGTIEGHMKGEWDGGNSHAVTGGHVLSGMTGEWGPAQFSVARAVANVNASGVFFEGANNLPKNIEGTQHAYYLATVNGNQKKLSNTKQSSFWPKDWSLDDVKATLDDSHTTNQANVYASKANTSYWYTWQSLGANTVFPVARYSKLD